MDNPTKDFEELFECFNKRRVRYVVVGGYARAFHGRPRYTKDIDLFVDPTTENAAALMAALADFGFGSLALTVDDFSTPGQTVQLGVEPNRIDLLTVIDGVSFDEVWTGRAAGRYGGQDVAYIGRDEFIKNKRAAGRLQDRADIEELL